jgi:hypothetical protein
VLHCLKNVDFHSDYSYEFMPHICVYAIILALVENWGTTLNDMVKHVFS